MRWTSRSTIKCGVALLFAIIVGSTARVLAGGPGWVGYDWTVIDNGAFGSGGSNVYGYRCQQAVNTNTYAHNGTSVASSAYCPPGGSPSPVDADRLVASLSLRSYGVECAWASDVNSTTADIWVRVYWSPLCSGYGRTSVHRSYWFKGGFCVPADDCVYGYQSKVRGPFAP